MLLGQKIRKNFPFGMKFKFQPEFKLEILEAELFSNMS
jgi:hypothetical protein